MITPFNGLPRKPFSTTTTTTTTEIYYIFFFGNTCKHRVLEEQPSDLSFLIIVLVKQVFTSHGPSCMILQGRRCTSLNFASSRFSLITSICSMFKRFSKVFIINSTVEQENVYFIVCIFLQKENFYLLLMFKILSAVKMHQIISIRFRMIFKKRIISQSKVHCFLRNFGLL